MKNPIRSDTNWGIDISFACGSIYTEMKNLAEKDAGDVFGQRDGARDHSRQLAVVDRHWRSTWTGRG